MKKVPDIEMEYINIAILFGYIGFFSSICNFVPAVGFVGLYMKSITDVNIISTVY